MTDATTLQVPGPHGVREVRLSSPDKVLWPGTEASSGRPVTKRDLADYLRAVAEPFLHLNGERPT